MSLAETRILVFSLYDLCHIVTQHLPYGILCFDELHAKASHSIFLYEYNRL